MIFQAIGRMTYSTESGADRGTVYYYRNLLNARYVKGEVKNAYRGYKHLYYTYIYIYIIYIYIYTFIHYTFILLMPFAVGSL